MANLQQFQIIFDNPTSTYNAGQILSGTVLVQVDRPKRINGIELHVIGMAEVKWTKDRNEKGQDGKTEKVVDEFWAQEQYYTYKYYVVGNADSNMVLPVGENRYTFNALLPQNLPTSFEGTYGHVRYTVRARLDRPWTFHHDTKAVFTVISPLDLNTEPTIQDGVKVTREKNLCCWCCKSGPISMTVRLSSTGFVPGQNIPITVEVDNCSDQNVSDVTCNLIQISTFRSKEPREEFNTDQTNIASLDMGSVNARDSQTFQQTLQVPAIPPSYLRNCSIINVNYKLLFETSFDGPHLNLDAEILIVIGTIPLKSEWISAPAIIDGIRDPNKQSNSNISVHDPNNVGDPGIGWNKAPIVPIDPSVDISSVPSDTSTPAMPAPTCPDSTISTPLYTNCILGPSNIEDGWDSEYTMGDKQFVPCYPTYSFNK